MALGFTSHFAKQEQPFGSLLLSNNESETAGSVACSDSHYSGLLYTPSSYDSCDFSVSVNIDYSQYANFVAASSSTETAGSVAYSGGDSGAVSGAASFSCGCSVSSGGCSPAAYTC